MTDPDPNGEQQPSQRPPPPETGDEKGAGPINDPGSGVSEEDGSEDPDNMGRA